MVALERRQVRSADEALRLVVQARPGARGGQALDERPEERRGPPGPLGEQVGRVGVVAAEELVAALARESDLHVVGCEPGDEVGRERRGVRERLVEGLRQRGKELGRVGAEHELVVIGSVALGHEPGIRQLVEAPLLEADREGAKRLGDLLRRERREHRRVDPAREEHADRDVRHELRADRVAQPRTQLLDELGLLVAAHLLRAERGRAARTGTSSVLPVLPGEHVARRELADAHGRSSAAPGPS